MWLLGLDHKTHCGSCRSPSLLDHSGKSQLACYENNLRSLWRGPCGKESKSPANVSMPSWKQVFQPQSGLQMTAAPDDTLTATSGKNLSFGVFHYTEIGKWSMNIHTNSSVHFTFHPDSENRETQCLGLLKCRHHFVHDWWIHETCIECLLSYRAQAHTTVM